MNFYQRLQAEVGARGLGSVEQLLEEQASNGLDLTHRNDAVKGADLLRNGLFAKYGEMPDSTDLISEDRAR